LCIVSEDCPPRLGAYGDTLARTPHLDALAARGVTWEVACSTAPVCAPSRFAILTGRHAPSTPPAQHMSAVAHLPADVPTYPQVMRDAGYYCTNNFKTHYNCDVDPQAIWDQSSDTAHWRNRPASTPFLAVFNCMTTHESCVFRQTDGAVVPADVAIPPYLPDTPGTRRALATYYNCIEQMDAFMGERLAELEAAGVADDTIVFYYSDHGSPLPRSKRFCYDEGVRVPFIVHVPPKWRHLLPVEPGGRVTTPVSLVDLFPTFAAIAGVEAPPGLHGHSIMGPARTDRTYAFSARDRMDEHYDMVRTARSDRFRYIRNYAPHRIWGQHYAFAWESAAYQEYEQAWLDGDLDTVAARFWQRKPAEELYDTVTDPHALVNLVDAPEHAETLKAMRAALDGHMTRIHDAGFIPETDHPSQLADDFPHARVLELAGHAIAREPARLPAFQALLSDPSPIVRFWAAQGLLMLAVDGHPLPSGLADDLDHETDNHVRIALIEALGHGSDALRAVTQLTDIARTAHDDRVRLQALDALCALPPHPEISLTLMQELAVDPEEYVRGIAGYLKLRLEETYTPASKVFRFDLFRAGMAQSNARRA
jgi:arylsulfatase A-like enzyme